MAETQWLGPTYDGAKQTVLRAGHDDDGIEADASGGLMTEGTLDLVEPEGAPVGHHTDVAHRRAGERPEAGQLADTSAWRLPTMRGSVLPLLF